jgi:hypothetical protein
MIVSAEMMAFTDIDQLISDVHSASSRAEQRVNRGDLTIGFRGFGGGHHSEMSFICDESALFCQFWKCQ